MDDYSAASPSTPTTDSVADQLARMRQQIDQLEARVTELESRPAARRSSSGSSSGGPALPRPEWARDYEVATLEAGDTWIEMHEPSARPQLHRLITQLVTVEGPVTESLALRRVREAWGIKRAGQRIQQTFDQALRQLVARGELRRMGDDGFVLPDQSLEAPRMPVANEDASRRSVDEIPASELELALLHVVGDAGSIGQDDATMHVAKLFGWTRRGTEIQTRLDARVQALVDRGDVARDGTNLRRSNLH